MFTRIIALARNILQSREGAVAIHMGLIIASLIGMGALASEIGFVTYKHRQMQSAADAAAFGAAIALSNSADFTLQAKALTAAVGFVDGTGGVTVTVNKPPASGTYAGQAGYVEVIITQPWTLSVVGAVNSLTGSANPTGLFTLGVQAVATAGGSGACVVALNTSACGALTISNNAIVQPPPCDDNCGVAANSTCSSAIVLNNNAQINGPVTTPGNWSLSNGAKLNCTPQKSGANPMLDPYLAVPLPPSPVPACTAVPGCPSTCTTTCNANGTVNLTQGHYPFGWNFTNGQTLNLSPGVYYIDNQLNMGNGVTVNATGGVTLVLNGNYSMSIGNNAIINITAPATGPTAGLAIASIRTNTKTQTFSNNANLTIKGALYFPGGTANFSNNATITATDCTQLIAGKITYSNNAALNDSNCKAFGASQVGGSVPKLVE